MQAMLVAVERRGRLPLLSPVWYLLRSRAADASLPVAAGQDLVVAGVAVPGWGVRARGSQPSHSCALALTLTIANRALSLTLTRIVQ